MKMYNKPEIFVTEFTPNEAVTVCTTKVNASESFTTNQSVNCFVTESAHNLFVRTNETGCTENANDKGYLVSGTQVTWTNEQAAEAIGSSTDWWDPDQSGAADNSKWYFLWYTGSNDTSTGSDNRNIFTGDSGLFKHIFDLLKLNDSGGWHLGFATTEMTTWATHS